MESVGWVVHQVVTPAGWKGGEVWAWCRVQVSDPGYSEMAFTKADGATGASRPDGELRLGPVLFKVWC